MEEKKYEEWQDLPMDYDENNPWTKNRNEEYLNNKKTSEVNGKNNND